MKQKKKNIKQGNKEKQKENESAKAKGTPDQRAQKARDSGGAGNEERKKKKGKKNHHKGNPSPEGAEQSSKTKQPKEG